MFNDFLSTSGYLIFKDAVTTNIHLSKINYLRNDTIPEFKFTGLSDRNEHCIMPNKHIQEFTVGVDEHQDTNNNLDTFKDLLTEYRQKKEYTDEVNKLQTTIDFLQNRCDNLEYALQAVESTRNNVNKSLEIENCIYMIWRDSYLDNTVFYFKLTPDFINTKYFETLFKEDGWYSNEFRTKCVDYNNVGVNLWCYINANTSANRFEHIYQLQYEPNEHLSIHEATYKLFKLELNRISKILTGNRLDDDLSDFIFVSNTSNFLSDIASE